MDMQHPEFDLMQASFVAYNNARFIKKNGDSGYVFICLGFKVISLFFFDDTSTNRTAKSDHFSKVYGYGNKT